MTIVPVEITDIIVVEPCVGTGEPGFEGIGIGVVRGSIVILELPGEVVEEEKEEDNEGDKEGADDDAELTVGKLRGDTMGDMDGSVLVDVRVTGAGTVVGIGVRTGCGVNAGVKAPEVEAGAVFITTGITAVGEPFNPPGLQVGRPPIAEINASSADISKAAPAPDDLGNFMAVGNVVGVPCTTTQEPST